MPRYPLVGGPCDGQQSNNYTLRPPLGLVYSCAGTRYLFAADGKFHEELKVGLGDAALGGEGRQAFGAWSRLLRVLGLDAPAAISRSKAARKRLARTVR